ncbi:MAG: hypothetical protein KGZ58_13775 [Ignavibacteriales bacterium]|nr:hypothetical protein [Ignavibacteriales bacterium]
MFAPEPALSRFQAIAGFLMNCPQFVQLIPIGSSGTGKTDQYQGKQ